MRTEYSFREAMQVANIMAEQFDVVRFVEPAARRVLKVAGCKQGLEAASDECCGSIWGRCDRCENCTSNRSNRALHNKDVAFKLELLNDITYLVVSRYMKVDGIDMVMEEVKAADKDFLLSSKMDSEIGLLIEGINRQLITDPLTGTFNRRFLDENFIPSLDCCHDHDLKINIAVMDIDDFKTVNDKFGHQAGDMLLKDVAGFWNLHFCSREKGMERMVVRYGGDEFVIAGMGVTADQFKNEIYSKYEEMRKTCYFNDGTHFRFSISYGIASSEDFAGKEYEWADIFYLADKRMYEKKQEE